MSEEISFGDRLQIHFLEMNSSEKHNVLGPVYAHLVGCVAVPCARVADAVKSALEGLESGGWYNQFGKKDKASEGGLSKLLFSF